jgi:hypothetical protein
VVTPGVPVALVVADAAAGVSGGVKTVEIGRFESRVFGVDGAEVLRGLVIER